jgi:hypothetical protein
MVEPFRVQLLQHAHHFLAVLGVEVAGRFVGQDQLGLRDQRAGDRDALLLAARQLARPVLGAVRDADPVHHLVDAALALGGGDTCDRAAPARHSRAPTARRPG